MQPIDLCSNAPNRGFGRIESATMTDPDHPERNVTLIDTDADGYFDLQQGLKGSMETRQLAPVLE